MENVGNILSALRKKRKLSQRRVANDLGISQALLSHYENGAREPKIDFIIKACDYYKVSADYILGRSVVSDAQTLPAPHGCDGAPRLISAANAVFAALDAVSDPELYAAAVNYLLIPTENTATLLHAPDTPYDPMRDAALKQAESEFITLARKPR